MSEPYLTLILFNKVKAEVSPRATQLDYIIILNEKKAPVNEIKTMAKTSAALENSA